MKITPNQAARILMKDNCWSYYGALALCEYIDEIDPNMELDVVAIRCEFTEYPTAWEAASDTSDFYCEIEDDFSQEDYELRREEEALEFLRSRTTVIEFNGGIIVGRF